MRSVVFGMILFVLSFVPVSAQQLIVGGIEGDGYFDQRELRYSFIGCMTDQAATTHWVVRDGNGLPDQEVRCLPRIYLTYRYGYATSTNGQSGSGGIWCVSGGGSSTQGQQIGFLALRIMVYGPGNTVLFNRQVQAATGEKYPIYSNTGISTPYFNASTWSSSNSDGLMQLSIQQQLMAVASAKATQSLMSWWSDPSSAPYRMASRPFDSPTEPIQADAQAQFGTGGPPVVPTAYHYRTRLTPSQLVGARKAQSLEVYTPLGGGKDLVKIRGVSFRLEGSAAVYDLPFQHEGNDLIRFYFWK